MSYISHTDYTKMLNAFGKETPKGVLKEGLDPVGKEDEDIDNDGKKNTKRDKYLAKRRKAVGKAISKNKTVKESGEGDVEVLNYLGKDTYEIKRPDGKVSQVTFDNVIEDEVDPPYGYSGYISGEDNDYYYTMDAQFVDIGGGDYDVDPEYDTLDIRDKSKKEGLHTPPLQATGPTVDVTENSVSNPPFGFDVLSPDERKQLKEFIESYKTIKGEIAKLLEKAGKSGKIMEDRKEDDEAVPAETPMQKPGGNRTGLVMTKAEMWENKSSEEIKNKIKPEVVNKVDQTLNVLKAVLKKQDLDDWEIEMFIRDRVEKKGIEAWNAQHDPY